MSYKVMEEKIEEKKKSNKLCDATQQRD